MIQYTKSGIIRRIDDLGRVVIPKDLRRQCMIEEGDPLEIMIGADESGNSCFIIQPYRKPEELFAKECKQIAYDAFAPEDGMDIALFVDDMPVMSKVVNNLNMRLNSDFAISIRKEVGEDSVLSQKIDDSYVYAVILRRGFEPFAILAAVTPDKITATQ